MRWYLIVCVVGISIINFMHEKIETRIWPHTVQYETVLHHVHSAINKS